jgi:hypothetical protein
MKFSWLSLSVVLQVAFLEHTNGAAEYVAAGSTFQSNTPSDVQPYVPASFDCAIRQLALDFAQAKDLGPEGYDLSTVYDALQLSAKCGFGEGGTHPGKASLQASLDNPVSVCNFTTSDNCSTATLACL